MGAAVLIEELSSITSFTIVHVTRMNEHAEDVRGLSIARPFMVNRVADIGELDRFAIGTVQDLRDWIVRDEIRFGGDRF